MFLLICGCLALRAIDERTIHLIDRMQSTEFVEKEKTYSFLKKNRLDLNKFKKVKKARNDDELYHNTNEYSWYFLKFETEQYKNIFFDHINNYYHNNTDILQSIKYLSNNIIRIFLSKQEIKEIFNSLELDHKQAKEFIEVYNIPHEIKYAESKRNWFPILKGKKEEHIELLIEANSKFEETFQEYANITCLIRNLYIVSFQQTYYRKQMNKRSKFKQLLNMIDFFHLFVIEEEYFTVDDFIEELKKSPYVYSIQKSPKIKLLNRFATGYVQTGSYDMDNYEGRVVSKNPFHELGYTGKDEIITIFDSGLSNGITWFKDDSHEYPQNSFNLLHRKVINYINLYKNTIEDIIGHGTHVATTASGKANEDSAYSLYDGAAPDSKIIFVSLENGNGDLVIDINFDSIIRQIIQQNSYICSNSWAISGPTYSLVLYEQIYDSYATNEPNLLFVFSAGNDGLYHTISTPGSSKNVLTVGSIEQLKTSSILNISQPTSLTTNNHVTYKVKVNNVIDDSIQIIDDLSYPPYNYYNSLINSNVIYNSRVVEYDKNSVDYKMKSVIVSNCEQANEVINNGASSIIVTDKNHLNNGCNIYASFAYQMKSEDIDKIKNQNITIVPKLSSINNSIYENIAVASYSSKGPNNMRSIKPEIVAPGTRIISAKNMNNVNDLSIMSGTSMSTPLVSGSIATLRQYLKNKFNNIELSSDLIKALVITSADNPLSNNAYPTYDYGFGILNLSNIINELSGNNIGILSINHFSQNSYIFAEFEIRQMPAHDLRIGMSYLDFPFMSQNSLLNMKVNMIVISPNGQIYYSLSGISDKLEDMTSTVERVIIPHSNVQQGNYKIILSSSESTLQYSDYQHVNISIVVLGDIEENLIQNDNFYLPNGSFVKNDISISVSSSNFNWSSICDFNHGHATSNGCICDDQSLGTLCQNEFYEISFGSSTSVIIQSMETKYFSTMINNNYRSFSFRMAQHNINYLSLQMNVGSSNKRYSFFQYIATFNTTEVNVNGPIDIWGEPIQYDIGTRLYYSLTNIGPESAFVRIEPEIVKEFISPIQYFGFFVAAIVIIIIIIIISIIFCKKRKHGVQNVNVTEEAPPIVNTITNNHQNSNENRASARSNENSDSSVELDVLRYNYENNDRTKYYYQNSHQQDNNEPQYYPSQIQYEDTINPYNNTNTNASSNPVSVYNQGFYYSPENGNINSEETNPNRTNTDNTNNIPTSSYQNARVGYQVNPYDFS